MKIHALFAMSLYPGTTYEEIMASEGTEFDMYGKGKAGIFGMLYGGDWSTLVKNLGIREQVAKAAFEDFGHRYPGVNKARQKTFDAFCSMRQPGGIGSAVVWADPANYIETFLGFRRYFTLENKVSKALFDLARKPPRQWRDAKVKVMRRDRVQTAGGAVASALYAAAFGMQAANMRAAANHEIQSPGGEITKAVQRAIWEVQPAGVHDWLVAPLNIHDEIQCVTHSSVVPRVTENIRRTVESYRPQVPLIGMTWFESMDNWAEKKGGAAPVKIRAPEMLAA
jgi:DNA polymerase I-like protein with 3'-5' exonuclease and polymerase domains